MIRKKYLLEEIRRLEEKITTIDLKKDDIGCLYELFNDINTEIVKLLTRCDELEEKVSKLSSKPKTREIKTKNDKLQ